jgi:hypothetical protein
MDKGTIKDLQSTTQKINMEQKDLTTKTGGELRCSGREAVPVPLMAPVM